MIDLLTSITFYFSLVSIVGCILNILKRQSCFIIWACSATGFAVYNIWVKPDYGQAVIWVAFVITDIWGYLDWSGTFALWKSKIKKKVEGW